MADLTTLDTSTLIDRIDVLIDSLKAYDDLTDNEVAFMIQSEQIKEWLWMERDISFARSLAEPNEYVDTQELSGGFVHRFMNGIYGVPAVPYSDAAIRETFGKYFAGTPFVRPVVRFKPVPRMRPGRSTPREPDEPPSVSPSTRPGPTPVGTTAASPSPASSIPFNSSSSTISFEPESTRAPAMANPVPVVFTAFPSHIDILASQLFSKAESEEHVPSPEEHVEVNQSPRSAGKMPQVQHFSVQGNRNASSTPIAVAPMPTASTSTWSPKPSDADLFTSMFTMPATPSKATPFNFDDGDIFASMFGTRATTLMFESTSSSSSSSSADAVSKPGNAENHPSVLGDKNTSVHEDVVHPVAVDVKGTFEPQSSPTLDEQSPPVPLSHPLDDGIPQYIPDIKFPLIDTTSSLERSAAPQTLRVIPGSSTQAAPRLSFANDISPPSTPEMRDYSDSDNLPPPSPLSGSDASSILNFDATCSICFDVTPREETFDAPCAHTYCASCVERFVENFTRDETLFPFRCCQEPIAPQDVVPFISDSLRKVFNEKMAEYSVAVRFRLYCHSQSCSAFLGSYPPIVIRRSSITSVRCSECQLETCPKCKQDAHPGEPDCKENQSTVELKQLARREGWQKCSSCKWLVERTAGCNHLVCRCGYQFCYYCAKPWSPIHDCVPNTEYV